MTSHLADLFGWRRRECCREQCSVEHIVRTPADGKKKEVIKIEVTDITGMTDRDCPICHEVVGKRNTDGYREKWVYLPCGHRFGSACLAHWLLDDNNRDHQCPMCRRSYHCLCGHLWLPQKSMSKAEINRLAEFPPEAPVPEMCFFCSDSPLHTLKRFFDPHGNDALHQGCKQANIPGKMRLLKPRMPVCRSQYDMLWKVWFQAKLEQAAGPRRVSDKSSWRQWSR